MGKSTELKLEDRYVFHLGYEPSLDGLRGISILSVLGFNGNIPFLRGGFVGVDIFFVLSGFLITVLLVQEFQRTSGIRLRDFYLRRAVRLLPALFVVMLASVAYALLFQADEKASLTLKGVLYTLFYAANWAQVPPNPPGIGALSHAWSLSVEEQFYIVWPLMLITLLKLTAKSLALSILAFLIGISIFLNVWFWHEHVPFLRMYFGTDTRANEILIGCFAALVLCWGLLQHTNRLKWVLHSAAVASLAALFFAFFGFRHNEWFVYNGGFAVVSIITAILIADLVLFPSLISRCFEFAPLVWIGKISYGLYLWHFPILEASKKLFEGRMSYFLYTLTGMVVSLLVATASYYLLERPLLGLRRRDNVRINGAQFAVGSASNA